MTHKNKGFFYGMTTKNPSPLAYMWLANPPPLLVFQTSDKIFLPKNIKDTKYDYYFYIDSTPDTIYLKVQKNL